MQVTQVKVHNVVWVGRTVAMDTNNSNDNMAPNNRADLSRHALP